MASKIFLNTGKFPATYDNVKSIKNIYVGVNDVNKVVRRAYVGVDVNGTTTPKLFFTQLPLMMSSSASTSNNIPKIDSLSEARYDLCATTSSHTATDESVIHQAWFGGGMTGSSSTSFYKYVQRYSADLVRQTATKLPCNGGGGIFVAVSAGNYAVFLGGYSTHTVHYFNVTTGSGGGHQGAAPTTNNSSILTSGGAAVLKNNQVFFGGGNLGTSIRRLDCTTLSENTVNNYSYLYGTTTAAAIADEYAVFCTFHDNLCVVNYEGTIAASSNTNTDLTTIAQYKDLIAISGENYALFIGGNNGFTIDNKGTKSMISTSGTPRIHSAGTKLGNHILIAGGVAGEEDISSTQKKEKLYQSIDVYNGKDFVLEASETNSILSEPRAHLAATTLTVKDYKNGNDKFSGDCAIFAGGYSSKTINISNDTVDSVTASGVIDVLTIKAINNYN